MTFLPIVEREMRMAARKPATYWLRFFAALAVIVIILFAFASMGSSRSSAELAKETFGILSFLLMLFCLFAGMFQTADCLSSEKREGTLGLLFLTDLRGYDVVLGKLAANSLHSIYGLMAVLPILAIPLLAGGITQGEFWRTFLALLAGLFFSLGVGMAVSAMTRETRQALAISALLIICIAGLLPALYEALNLLFKIKVTGPLLWPSLGYTLNMSSDLYYNYRTGPHDYWGSLLTIIGIGVAGLLVASLVLPRAWHEKIETRETAKGESRWRRLRFGAKQRRQSLRALLAFNPFYWLACRDRLSRIGFWIAFGIGGPFWLLFFGLAITWGTTSPPSMQWFVSFETLNFITAGLCLVFKCIAAAEASRRFCDDHKSGALELMLVTPLTEENIISGQRQALWRLFIAPIILLELIFVSVLFLYNVFRPDISDEGVYTLIIIGNMIVLLTDFWAMGWVGMWTGLRARYHHRAVVFTLLRILVIPWLLYFLIGMAGLFDGSSPIPLFVVWYALCIFNDLLWAILARNGLRRGFRLHAADLPVKARARLQLAAANYSNS